MPANLQTVFLILIFIVPGFVFTEVDARLRPAQKIGPFERTILSILFSTILHSILICPLLLFLVIVQFDFSNLFDSVWLMQWGGKHPFILYIATCAYFFIAVIIAGCCGIKIGTVTREWMPIISRVLERERANSVLVQMKNGDFYTGLLDMIPADYDILQSPAKDFTIKPPGRYKPKGQAWQKLEDTEVVLLNTSNVDAIRIIKLPT